MLIVEVRRAPQAGVLARSPASRASGPERLRWWLLAGLAVFWSFDLVRVGDAAPAVVENFGGPQTKWQLLEGTAPAKILAQQTVVDGARDRSGAERVVVGTAIGHSAPLGYPVAPMAAIDEFEARLWVKSSQPGVQLGVRVVLPRTADPRTGRAATTLVRSAETPYDRPGQWRQMIFKELPKLLAAEVRVMRALPGAAVDPREAYVDAIVLLVPGSSGGIEITTDEMELDGVVLTGTTGSQPGGRAGSEGPSGAAGPAFPTGSSLPEPVIRLTGGVLQVNGRLFFPRVIAWNGEPLEFLAERGFNVVHIHGLPTDEQNAEAARHDLWYLCTPPGPEKLSREGALPGSQRILAWFLADPVAQRDPDYLERWAGAIRVMDRQVARPIVAAPTSHWNSMSRIVDILLVDHPRSARFSERDLAHWWARCKALARPGTPFWCSLPMQVSEATAEQIRSFGSAEQPSPSVDGGKLESLAIAAAMLGSRGSYFESRSALNADDGAARRRAMRGELINCQLEQWGPWLAGGKVIARLGPATPNEYSETRRVVMQVDYARMLVPEVADFQDAGVRSYLLPGIPDSNRAYLFNLAEIRSVAADRVAGGRKVVLSADDEGCVLFTEDPQAIAAIRQQVARDGARIAKLLHDLAALEEAQLSGVDRSLAKHGVSLQRTQQPLATAREEIARAKKLLDSGDAAGSYRVGNRARRLLGQVKVEQGNAVAPRSPFFDLPTEIGEEETEEHLVLLASLQKLRGGTNLLYGGDFEDLGNLIRFGWEHVNHPQNGIAASAELSTTAPKFGKYCLQLTATEPGGAATPPRSAQPPRPASPARLASTGGNPLFDDPFRQVPGGESPPAEPVEEAVPPQRSGLVVEAAPVWIASPAVPIRPGETYEITGWVRIVTPIDGSIDGFLIVDSLGGEELALSIEDAEDWKAFRLVRRAHGERELKVSFILTGIGAVQIDGVMIRALAEPIARRLPPVVNSSASPLTPPVGEPGSSSTPERPKLLVTPQ